MHGVLGLQHVIVFFIGVCVLLLFSSVFVVLVSCDRKCSVLLPDGAVCWSTVCNFGIS